MRTTLSALPLGRPPARITAFLTDTGRGVIPHQVAGLELRHRQHAWVEDRIPPGQVHRPSGAGQADLLRARARRTRQPAFPSMGDDAATPRNGMLSGNGG